MTSTWAFPTQLASPEHGKWHKLYRGCRMSRSSMIQQGQVINLHIQASGSHPWLHSFFVPLSIPNFTTGFKSTCLEQTQASQTLARWVLRLHIYSFMTLNKEMQCLFMWRNCLTPPKIKLVLENESLESRQVDISEPFLGVTRLMQVRNLEWTLAQIPPAWESAMLYWNFWHKFHNERRHCQWWNKWLLRRVESDGSLITIHHQYSYHCGTEKSKHPLSQRTLISLPTWSLFPLMIWPHLPIRL